MEEVAFTPLVEPSDEVVAAFARWENDPLLIPLARPNKSQADLESAKNFAEPAAIGSESDPTVRRIQEVLAAGRYSIADRDTVFPADFRTEGDRLTGVLLYAV